MNADDPRKYVGPFVGILLFIGFLIAYGLTFWNFLAENDPNIPKWSHPKTFFVLGLWALFGGLICCSIPAYVAATMAGANEISNGLIVGVIAAVILLCICGPGGSPPGIVVAVSALIFCLFGSSVRYWQVRGNRESKQ